VAPEETVSTIDSVAEADFGIDDLMMMTFVAGVSAIADSTTITTAAAETSVVTDTTGVMTTTGLGDKGLTWVTS
jgi:hypothetical protein